MKLFAWIHSLAAKFVHRSEIAEQTEEELRFHIGSRADDLERSGLTRAEAERRARIEFGSYQKYREESHQALGGNFIETLLRDVRFAFRLLRKSPGFATTAILTLALAIGANAVVFCVLNALVLRPLDLPQADSLYGIEHGDEFGFQSWPNYLDLRDRNHSFDGLAVFSFTQEILDTGNNPSHSWGYQTSSNYFDVLRIQPYLGRLFHPSDEHGLNSAPFVVLTYAFWHSHFQDDRGVIGRVVQLNKHPFTVVGVAPPGFHGTLQFFTPDFFMPIVNQGQVSGWNGLEDRGNRWIFEVLGHLKPGVTPAQATADLNSIGAYLEKTYPKNVSHKSFILARPSLYGSFLGGPVRGFVAGLMLLASLILLAACANLGSLFAARAADRSREVALRLALGSSRNRILRQLMTEALLISLAGGALGLIGSVALLKRLSMWQPFPQFPIHVIVTPDAKVYAIAFLLATVSGFLFGIVPVRQVLRANPWEIVKAGSTGVSGRRITLRDALLVLQIAICAVLVTSSLVAVRGLVRSLHSNFGFEPRNAVVADLDLVSAGYSGDRVPPMQKRIIDAVAAIPGVDAVATVNGTPLSGGSETRPVFKDETRDLRVSNAAATSYMFVVSPDYFHAAGTTLLTGRPFSLHDDSNAPRVAVVNQEFARVILGSAAGAVGRYFKFQDGTRFQVVGVVENGKYLGLNEDQRSAFFIPVLQMQWNDTSLVVRSSRDPQQVAAAIRATLREIEPGLPVDIQTWTRRMDFALFPSRVATVALGILGVMGAMLSITGIFGMAAYSVSKRLRELGIRIALGAQRAEILRAALGRAVRLLAIGSAAGLLLGILATRVLAYIVYQASARDPLVMAGVVLAMSLLGVLATWIPAQRALSVDPLILLRED